MADTVGIVGLGIMGGAIARNLVAVGWRAIGFDIDPARSAELEADGVEIAESVAAAASLAPSLITSLPSPQAESGGSYSRRARLLLRTSSPSRPSCARPGTSRSTAR